MDDLPLEAGIALLRAGQLTSAERFFRACLARRPDARAWFYLGTAQHALGRLPEAADSFGKSIELADDASDAHCARATVLVALGRSEAAEAELRRALERAPAHAQVLYNLAVLLEARKERTQAREFYDRALAAEPEHFAARLNRAALLLSMSQPEAALLDYDYLAARHPATAEIQADRATALLASHHDAEALEAAETALKLDPLGARAWLNRIIALGSLGRLGDAAKTLVEAQAAVGDKLFALAGAPRNPGELEPNLIYVGRALERNAECDWRDRDRLTNTLREATRAGNSGLAASPGILTMALALPLEPAEIGALADSVAGSMRARARQISPGAPAMAPKRDSRIRVGILSPEMRQHLGAFVLRRLIGERDRDRFEYFLYALNPDDGSAIRSELQRLADLGIDVSGWGVDEVVRRLRDDGLDILLDRTGYFQGTMPEVLAARAAPIQAGFMGTPCTLGTGLLDYRLSDVWTTPPDSQADWPERLVLLPPSYAVFDSDLPIPERGGRSGQGVAEDALVLCHFDLPFRIGPEVFRVWMRLLRAQPRAMLWLLDGGRRANANLRKEVQADGVAEERLQFVPASPYEAHLACLRHADLFLDTFIYGARSMAFNALRLGVPVLTCPGRTPQSRLALPFVRTLGLHDLVADSPEAYERKALELITTPNALDEAKRAVREARERSRVFDVKDRVRAVERAFIAMVERHRAGLPPDTLIID